MSNQENNDQKETAVEKRKPTISERFTHEVERQLSSALSQQVDLTEHQRQLMTNMFIKLDSALEEHEARRQKNNNNNQTPYIWDNVDMQKLALDAMHRIRLGLDALVDNHLHPIPYFNGKTKKYDLNLMIGFKGKLYYRKQVALHPVKDVRIELVHKNDDFSVTKKSGRESVEDYEFKINDPFDRGPVKGGFGYIIYEDEIKNEMIIVTKEDFDKSKDAAKSNKFWGPWEERMQLKTLTHRVAESIEVDPRKVNKSFHYVEAQDNPYKDGMEVQIDQPAAEERKDLDFDGSAQLNGPERSNDVDFEEQPEVEQQPDSTNGTQEAEQSTDQQEYDRALANVNNAGKEYWGTKWFKKSKEFLPEGAEYLTDLDIDQLKEVKDEIEAKAKAEA